MNVPRDKKTKTARKILKFLEAPFLKLCKWRPVRMKRAAETVLKILDHFVLVKEIVKLNSLCKISSPFSTEKSHIGVGYETGKEDLICDHGDGGMEN